MIRRLVKSPPAPKIVMVAGEGRRAGRHFATVAATSIEIVVIAILSTPGRPDEHQLRGGARAPAFPVRAAFLGRSHTALHHDFVHPAGTFAVGINSGVTLNCPAFDAMSQRSTTLGSPLMTSNAVSPPSVQNRMSSLCLPIRRSRTVRSGNQ